MVSFEIVPSSSEATGDSGLTLLTGSSRSYMPMDITTGTLGYGLTIGGSLSEGFEKDLLLHLL